MDKCFATSLLIVQRQKLHRSKQINENIAEVKLNNCIIANINKTKFLGEIFQNIINGIANKLNIYSSFCIKI